jgi:DAACS family dicarboxylate/amino acid:cation (Na+ or H+) symporter
MSRHVAIILGLAVGTLLGVAAHAWGAPPVPWIIDSVAMPLGQLFLRLIFMVVVPLVFTSLVLGVLEIGSGQTLSRIGLKTLLYAAVASGISVVIGITLTTWFRPGDALKGRALLVEDPAAQRAVDQAKAAKPLMEALLALIPKNPLAAAVDALQGEMMAFMVFAILFGLALHQVKASPLVDVLRGLHDVSMTLVGWAMRLAPLGVAGLMFAATAKAGVEVLSGLAGYLAVVLGGLLIQEVVVYSVMLRWLGRVSPARWFSQCREVLVTAFSSASSIATLPTSLRVAERLGVPKRIGSFVLTVGSSANQNGTALYEGVTVLFLAQVFGVDLSLSQQLVVVLMCVLAGIGTAGVPGGSLPLVVIVLQTVGIPAEGIGIILGVDRIADMCRTVVNVTGDLVVATVIARSEGELQFDATLREPP